MTPCAVVRSRGSASVARAEFGCGAGHLQSRAGRRRYSQESRQHARRRAQMIALFEREYHTLAGSRTRASSRSMTTASIAGAYYTMELLEGTRSARAAPYRGARVLVCATSLRAHAAARARACCIATSRRATCSARDGHAKLIDFGTMTPMGRSRVLVGTARRRARSDARRRSMPAPICIRSARSRTCCSSGRPRTGARFADLRDAIARRRCRRRPTRRTCRARSTRS